MGHVVSFRRPDDALIHLERDDLGTVNDTYVDQNGKTIVHVDPTNELIIDGEVIRKGSGI